MNFHKFVNGVIPMYTIKEIHELIGNKLKHNFGVSPDQASDELFYKASVLALLDLMRERRAGFRNEIAEKESKMVYL